MADGADGGHAGNGGETFAQTSVGGNDRLCRLVSALGKGQAEREMAIGEEAGVDPLHRDERADEQASARQQHDAQRDLHDEQRAARAVADR